MIPVFFFLWPAKWWERKGLDALERDEEGFADAMKERHPPLLATGRVAGNYRSTCPFYRGHWLDGGTRAWDECEINGHMTGAAWYQFCGKDPEKCPIFNQNKGEMQT